MEQKQIVDEKFNAFVIQNPYPSIDEWKASGYYGTPIYYAYLEHIRPQVGRNYNDPNLQRVNQRLFNRKGDANYFWRYFGAAAENYEKSTFNRGSWY